MSNKSDNNDQPRTNIYELLPEVYRSNLNNSLFEDAYNRHLTKDDLVHVSGFIGVRNPNALVNRQITEPTPFRQAFQLQPTMYAKVGTVDHALTQKGFFSKLELMGVDINRLQQWGNTKEFNWVPPININMLINYFDYYWPSSDPQDPAQYLTIENPCAKANGKVMSYETLLSQYGELHALTGVDPKAPNTFSVSSDFTALFIVGFVFFTKNTLDVNYADTFWTTASSTYDVPSNTTIITVQESIAIVQTTPPVTTIVGRWWYKNDTDQLFVWNGVAWVAATVTVSGDLSLAELLTVFQKNANCLCHEDFGWDLAPWDDNQVGTIVWDTALLTAISWPTEAAWIVANGPAAAYDLWYDTTNDQLNQRDPTNSFWVVVINKLSVLLVEITGQSRWDQTLTCIAPPANQWSQQNEWIHKTQVSSFGGVRRAQIPIIEYNSTIELNEWSEVVYSWKYRTDVGFSFVADTAIPSRFELEPVKGYAAVQILGVWYLYLFTKDTTLNRDIDYTDSFTPSTKFLIVDDTFLSDTYTVVRSEFRKILSTDPVNAALGLGNEITDYYVTVVQLVESVFASPVIGNGILNTRVEPRTTTKGDTWRGYQVHWLLDVNSTILKAAGSQPLNPRLVESLASTITAVPVVDGLLAVGISHQEFTTTVAGVTNIPLDSSFLYTPAVSTTYATPSSNELRVYVNNIRQYGTYVETTSTGLPNYTLVGSTPTLVAPIPYVTGITFNIPLNQFDVVRMEVGPASRSDMGNVAVPVRTVEDEVAFTAAVVAGTQPVYMSLTEFQNLEQVKTLTNQYPLFNVYDICENTIVDASSIFAYKEDPTFPIDVNIGRRIVTSNSGRDFTFLQYLLDRDDNILYGYRNLENAPAAGTFWYSADKGFVKFWDGQAWSDSAFISTVNGLALRSVAISILEPADLLNVDGALWLKKTTQELFQRDAVGALWALVPQLVVSDADPSFQTVWKNSNNHEYVPNYVDKDRNPVPIGDPTGDWELLNQWFYNSEHKNKQQSTYSQLVTHFSSIVKAQPNTSGLPGGGVYALTQNEYNYSLGGTIKDHNDSFDTLISAINITNISPIGLIEWAMDQYELGLLLMQDLFNRNFVRLFGDFSTPSLIDQGTFIGDDLISQFKLNDFLSLVYGDTTAYNPDTGIGMPNWIGTIPIFLLGDKHVPHLVVDDFVELYHHDGHRTRITYSGGEIDRFARQLIAVTDPRGGNGKLGIMSTSSFPTTAVAFTALAAFGGAQVRTGVYWYQLGGGIQSVYRFVPYTVQTTDPSFFFNGVELPDDIRYYNSATLEVKKKVGLTWVVETSGGIITTLWEKINFAQRLGAVDLNVEQQLYDAVPFATQLKFDYSTLAVEPTVYNNEYQKRFFAFVAERNIKAPLVNTTYSPTNAFTWNYVSSIITTPPRVDITPVNAASWQGMYTRWYGTPYPHLEPWTLQGFTDKPTWWDATYLNNDPVIYGTRRWKYIHATTTGMWENIRTGVVPAGRLLADGATISIGAPGEATLFNYFSVNIADTVVGGIQSDELFPPYLSATTAGFAASVRSLFSVITEIIAPDADYVFGDLGPTEWLWTVSPEYVYDIPIIAFIMQPVRFMHYSFGLDFIDVDKLQVETVFCQVYSHEDALFHGDLYNTNVSYVANGLNQWYVNYNRFSGFDTNNEFRQLWAGWNPQQSYSFAGIVDTSTFDITTKFFDVSTEDYKIILANTGVFKDLWTEGFEVSVLSIPSPTAQYNNQSAWRFDLDSLALVDRTLTAYDVKQYPFVVDIGTDEGTLYRYSIIDAVSASKRFYVSGNQTAVFTTGLSFTVTGSPGNDGTYTVSVSAFESVSNRTRITVNETVAFSLPGGQLDVAGFIVPWETGQQVVITSSRNLPSPIVADEPYYIIKTGQRTFRLAETASDAAADIFIDFGTLGDGEILVGEVVSSFLVYGGASITKDTWYHFAFDKTKTRSYTPPTSVTGMQNLINFFDGYQEFQKDTGIVYNLSDNVEFDEATGRTINWQFEEERFINWAYNLRRSRLNVSDKFPFSVGGTPTQLLTFGLEQPAWESGTAIVFGTTGSLPAPLVAGTPYYFVATSTPGTLTAALTATPIVTPTTSPAIGGSGTYYDFTLTIDGTGPITYSVNLVTADTITSIATKMQTAIGDGVTVVASGNALVITSSTTGSLSTVAITYPTTGTNTDLFNAILAALTSSSVVFTEADGTSAGSFKVSITSNVALPSNYVTVTTSGSGSMTVAQYRQQVTFPSFEVNPTRNNVWVDTPQGLLANVVTGPFGDIRISQTIFDQHGKPLTADKLNVFRQDQQSRIAMRPTVPDPLNLIPDVLKTQYDYLHLGGGHFFLEGYEHILLFNDYAVDGSLIYDQFYGLYASRFNLDYYESGNYTLRPTLGGYYLVNGQFFRNIEGSTVDLHNYYDTYALREGTVQAKYARKLLGYDGTVDYLDLVNMNAKSQFVFYRGMIHYKGSVAGAKAYINSRRFIDARLDEFWAWKVAEFGDSRPRIYPQIKLFSTDSQLQELRLHFLATIESPSDPDVVQAASEGFKLVEWTDPTRWQVFPEQKAEILSPLFLDAEISSFWKLYVSNVTPTFGQTLVDYWFDTTSLPGTFKKWNGTTWVATGVPLKIVLDVPNTTTYVKLDQPFDAARAIRRKLTTPGDLRQYQTTIYPEGTGVEEFQLLNSETMKFQTSGFSDIMLLFTVNPGFSRLNPSKLIDEDANVVVTTAQLWDPARNDHSSKAIHNVDLQHAGDPAGYTVSIAPSLKAVHAWGQEHTQQLWLDTDPLGYVKYYDDKLYPSIDDRLNNWGKLADWASVNVYEWTASTVPPAQWATAGERQAGDILRPQRSKATGDARQTLFKRTRPSYTTSVVGITSGSQQINFSGAVITGLEATGIVNDSTAGSQDVLLTGSPKATATVTYVGTITPASSPAIGGGGTNYDFTLNINGGGDVNYTVNVVAADTMSTIAAKMQAVLPVGVTVVATGSSLKITGATISFTASLILTEPTLGGNPDLFAAIDTGFTTTHTTVNSPAVLTGYTGTAPFMANIFVDGTGHLISVTSVAASTYVDLVSQITAQMLGAAIATLVGTNTIRITSATTGAGSTIVIQDVNLFGSLSLIPAIPQLPVDGLAGTSYTATITIDGTVHNITITAGNATTYNDVIAQINTQLAGAGTATITVGNVTVTSATTGTPSTVAFAAGTLFPAITPDFVGFFAAVAGTYGTVQVVAGTFTTGATVLFTTTGTLPTPLAASTKYTVATVTPSGPNDLLTLTGVNLTTAGVPTTFTVVPAFETADWIRSPFLRERQYGAVDFTTPSAFEPTITLTSALGWSEFDIVDVYINDQKKVTGYVLTSALTISLTGTGITVFEKDIIDIVRPVRTLTAVETAFDPDTTDDGATLVQWKYDFEYTTFTTISGTTPQVTYYFWVQNSQFRDNTDNTALSAQEVAQQLEKIPTPYFTVHEPKDDPTLIGTYGYGLSPYGFTYSLADLAEQSLIIPILYREAVLHKASNYITEDDRFVWRFTRDLTLRYTLKGTNNLKSKHEQWLLIRREQPTVIARELWDRLTEALIGYTLADNTVRVPSLERELYDALNNTDTRYGLGVDQAFCDKALGLATVLAYLEDPNIDFSPVDIDNFFATHSFDTPENIRTAMDDIYSSFSTQNTNNIWFETLLDAFATRAKYKEILKTSWIALHGIRVLEVGGIFDD